MYSALCTAFNGSFYKCASREVNLIFREPIYYKSCLHLYRANWHSVRQFFGYGKFSIFIRFVQGFSVYGTGLKTEFIFKSNIIFVELILKNQYQRQKQTISYVLTQKLTYNSCILESKLYTFLQHLFRGNSPRLYIKSP